MNNLCFHIGYHKTGSTTLQLHGFSLNKNLHLLSNSSPDFERAWHREVVETGDFQYDEIRAKSLLDTAVQARPGKKAYMISDESMSGHGFTGFNALRNAERLHGIEPNAKIFILIRNQISFLRSVYASYVFEGGSQTFSFWLSDHKYPITSIFDKLQYDLLINHYMELFGKENVLTLPYELFRSEGLSGILKRLYSFMSVTCPSEELESKKTDIRFRVALSNNTLLLFRLLNGLRGGCSLNQRRLMNLVNSFFLSRLPQANIFKGLDVAKTDNVFRESNRRTRELIGFDLSQFGYPL